MTKNDSVYAYGKSTYHTYPLLGLGPDVHEVSTPTEIVELRAKRVVKIYGGYTHMLAMSSRGVVWAWGDNTYAQLGQGDRKKSTFRPIEVPRTAGITVSDIACGNGQSYVLTSAGEIYAWGDNNNGQLGLGQDKHNITQTRMARSALTQVVDLRAMSNYPEVYALTQSGKVFIWGLGLGAQPRELDVNGGKSAALSVAVTAQHGYVLTKEGDVYVRKNTREQLHPIADLFYRGEHKLVILYADLFIGRHFLVGVTREGKLLIWRDELAGGHAFEVSSLSRIADVFGQQEPVPAYVGFMVAVVGDTTSITPLTTTTTARPITRPTVRSTVRPTTHHRFTVPPSTSTTTRGTTRKQTVKPVVTSTTGPSTLPPSPSNCAHANKILADIFNNPTVADIHFMLKDGSTLFASSHILSITSQYMLSQLAATGPWQGKREIEAKEYSAPTFTRYIRFLYLDRLEPGLDAKSATELSKLASAYHEERLKQLCNDIIHHH